MAIGTVARIGATQLQIGGIIGRNFIDA